MASEIRVDKINSLSGVGTVTLSPTGVDIAGITTAATLRATTGIVTSLTAGSLTSLGAVSGTTGTFTSTVKSGTTATGIIFSAGDSGNSGDRVIQFKRAATTNDINIQAINSGSGGTNLLFNQEGGAASFGGAISATTGTFTGDVDIADKIVHTGDTDTAIRFSDADTIKAETGGTERLRIDSNGKFCFGTYTSGYENNDSLANFINAASAGTDNPLITLWNPTTVGDARANIDFLTNDNSGTGRDGAFISARNDGSTAKAHLVFGTILNETYAKTVKFDTNGDVEIEDGNLVIKTSGKGIDFSATGDGSGTMSSELLDDYEEGTWTPALTFGGGSTGITYGSRSGTYTKIGRQVTLNFMVELTSKGSSTGDAIVGGVPYAISDQLSSTVIEANGTSSYWNNIEPDLYFLAFSAHSASGLVPRFQPETGAADVVDSLSNSQFTNTTNFRGSITYFTS